MPLETDLIPGERWSFDGPVAENFDDMLVRSIPDYVGMRRATFDVGSAFVRPKTAIVDLGASRGEAHAPFLKRFGAANHHVLAEVSPAMLDVLRARYTGEWTDRPTAGRPIVDIRACDLRREYPTAPASLTLAVLTLQFVPIEYRPTILARAYRETLPGGAMIVVEKVIAGNGDVDGLLRDIYWRRKAENGYSEREIRDKAAALEGVLCPLTASANEAMLRDAGFGVVECIWRTLNFAAWVAVKR